MPYDLKTLPDDHLKILFAVTSNLIHKAELANSRGPLPFGNAPQGVSNDEQMAILTRLKKESLIDFSISGELIYLCEYVDKSFETFYDKIHEEYHKRQKQTETKANTKPHYDEVNGVLHINNFKVKIRKHEEDTKQNQLLRYVFITNSKNIGREFDFTEFPFDDVRDKTKFKEICRTACTEINSKCAVQTQDKITDFVKFNTRTYGFLKINPKYLG